MALSLFCFLVGMVAFLGGAFAKKRSLQNQAFTSNDTSPEEQTQQNAKNSILGLDAVANSIPNIAAVGLLGAGVSLIVAGIVGMFFSLI